MPAFSAFRERTGIHFGAVIVREQRGLFARTVSEEFAMTLKPFACTIRIFDPTDGSTIEEHVLPVDSPDAEHAAASTLANAVSFTTKTSFGGSVKSVAFCCTRVEARG